MGTVFSKLPPHRVPPSAVQGPREGRKAALLVLGCPQAQKRDPEADHTPAFFSLRNLSVSFPTSQAGPRMGTGKGLMRNI